MCMANCLVTSKFLLKYARELPSLITYQGSTGCWGCQDLTTKTDNISSLPVCMICLVEWGKGRINT